MLSKSYGQPKIYLYVAGAKPFVKVGITANPKVRQRHIKRHLEKLGCKNPKFRWFGPFDRVKAIEAEQRIIDGAAQLFEVATGTQECFKSNCAEPFIQMTRHFLSTKAAA